MTEGGLPQDATQMKLDILSAMNFITAARRHNTHYNQELLYDV
jgi:hypothetical protein